MTARTMALQAAAQEFADRLNTLVNAAIRTDRRLGVNTAENADHAVVRTISDPGIRFEGFPQPPHSQNSATPSPPHTPPNRPHSDLASSPIV